MSNEKRRHTYQRNIARNKVEQYKNYNYHILNRQRHSQHADEDKDADERIAHIYKLFYAELIKLFVIEVELKNSNLTEIELDQNIFLSAEEYYKINDDMYQV